jgi:hypothetical protein
VALGLALGSPIAAADAGGQSHLLVVAGLGGEPQYRDAFHEWAKAMVGAAEGHGIPRENVTYLGEKPELDPALIDGPSTKAGIEKAFQALASRLGRGDSVLVLLLGHGTFQSGESRFNLPGPDLGAADLAALLDRLPAAKVAVVNAASASGEFAKALAGKDRIVVTATKSGMERNETVFGRYFVEAYAGEGADADKDGRVSLLEAFEYARRRVSRFYEAENRLLTEHAVLEDSGDGARARSFFLGGAAAAGAAAGAAPAARDPRIAALEAERAAVEERLEALKADKESMDAAAYEAELERLLVELAEKDQEIRKLAAGGRP